jgi:HEAT repeat protein
VGPDEGKKQTYAAAVLDSLTAGLTDPELRVRHNAALALAKLRGMAKPALAALLAACADPKNDTNLNIYPATIRQVMLRALGEAASGTPDAVPTFVAIFGQAPTKPTAPAGRGQKDLSDEERALWTKYATWMVNRRVAATGLGLAGEHGRPHAAKVRELLDSKDEDDRFEAKQALERMGLPAGGK